MPDSKCAFEEEGCLYKEDCADGGWDLDSIAASLFVLNWLS